MNTAWNRWCRHLRSSTALSWAPSSSSCMSTIYHNIVRQCQVRQYADGTSLAHVSSDVRDLENGLTDDLENVSKWVDANKLKLNMNKTQLVLMSRKRRRNELDSVCVKLDDQEVARTKSVKCLGW